METRSGDIVAAQNVYQRSIRDKIITENNISEDTRQQVGDGEFSALSIINLFRLSSLIFIFLSSSKENTKIQNTRSGIAKFDLSQNEIETWNPDSVRIVSG